MIERAFFSASTVNINSAIAMNFGLATESGAGIFSVALDSPADYAGLIRADIIVAMAARPVTNVADLDGILIHYDNAADVEVEFYRGDDRMTATVTFDE